MVQFETFSTGGLEPRRKLEYWNETACHSFTPIVSDPVDIRSFNGELTRTLVGDLRLAEVYSDPQIVQHTRSHVARSSELMFFLHMPLEGTCTARQDGREAYLRPGDFALCDTSRPYDLIFTGSNRMFVLGIPDDVMRRYIASPESVVSIRMPGDAGLSGMLSHLLRTFWRQYRKELDAVMGPHTMSAALDLMASAYSTLPQTRAQRSALVAAHRVRIIDYIEAHLADPDLTPTSIARACKITTRYLHQLFSEGSETVSRYILRRRLEECARALRRPAQRGHTVTSIAFHFGFNSPTHFGRAFRAQFGMTPREYRRQCTEGGA
jgi:AraC family transcriptional activator of tynA and feaB